MFHLAAYFKSTHATTLADLPALSDDILTIQNNHFTPWKPMNFFFGVGMATDLSVIQLVTPKTRQVVNPRLYPLIAALVPPTNPNWIDRRYQPFMLNQWEEIAIQNTTGGAADESVTFLMGLGDSLDPIPAGDIYSLHGTSTTAATANAWTSIAITFDTTLPAGTYGVIGAHVQSTNAQAHRFIFKDQIWRPGFLSVTALTNRAPEMYYMGGLGMLGRFTTITFPVLQVLCNGADNAHDVTWNIVRMG